MRVELTVESGKRRRWNPFRRWRFFVELPSSWEEVGDDRARLRLWDHLLHQGPESARAMVLDQHLSHLPRHIRAAITAEDRTAMLMQLGWIEVKASADPVIGSFKHGGVEYFFPKKGFENGACGEFALADNYYEAYILEEKREDLLGLVATIARENRTDGIESPVDRRCELHDREEAEVRAEKLSDLPDSIALAALAYFAGVKRQVAETFWVLFSENMPSPEPEADDDGEPSPQRESDRNAPKFGWWSKFLEVAETGLFGDYRQVITTRFYLVCMYLVDQHHKNERLKAEHDRMAAKYRTHT